MRKGTVQLIILLASTSLIGIVATQSFWVKQALELKEQQFQRNVIDALQTVGSQIKYYNNDTLSSIDPVEFIDSSYVVKINDTINPYVLEAYLQIEFKDKNITTDYEYGIYDCFSNQTVYHNIIDLKNEQETDSTHTQKHYKPADQESNNFWVRFPHQKDYVRSQMGTWLFSSIILLILMIISLTYIVITIVKQKKLSQMKTDFINNMTHEFKTPISTIDVSSDVLLKPEASGDRERLTKYAGIIKEENNRLKLQVERVLQMAVLQRKEVNFKKEEVDMNKMIESIVSKIDMELTDSTRIQTHLEATNSQVKGDEIHLFNATRNIIDNALKYCSDKPEINIYSKNADGELIITITDNGIGMSKEVQKRIFEQFYRAPTGDRHDVKGFGLGLYYVKKVLEMHKGKIKVESTPGMGSTFEIHLPIKS